jgi:hypothetical protein
VLQPGSAAIDDEHPNPAFTYLIKNMGGAGAGAVTATDELPAGIESTAFAPTYRAPETVAVPQGREGSCTAAGRLVTCNIPGPFEPGDWFELKIPIAVAAGLQAPSVINELTIEGGGAATIVNKSSTRVLDGLPSFGTDGSALYGSSFSEGGVAPLAGEHPFMTTFGLETPSAKIEGVAPIPWPALRGSAFELPEGLVVNPVATPKRCSFDELNGGGRIPIRSCDPESQVGEVTVGLSGIRGGVTLTEPLYNLIPPPGVPAELGFELETVAVTILGGLSGSFHLTARSGEILSRFGNNQIEVTLWGVPSDPRHDTHREGQGCQGQGRDKSKRYVGCPSAPSRAPFVTMPAFCGTPPIFGATVTTWRGDELFRRQQMTSADEQPLSLTGCNQLAFEPTIESRASTNAAETASGLEFTIHQPQDESLKGRATAPLRDATVTLPEGMSLNPAAANGLSGCSEEQMGYAPEEGKIRFATTPQSCPSSSKVGTIQASTPLLEDPISGGVYVAKPFDNPFGSLLAIYLAIEDEESGIVAKLAGKVEPDPATGQLRTTFTDNPELPISDIKLQFFNGVRGVLTTPLTCGDKTTTTTLTPWSSPEGADAHPTGSFRTEVGCQASEAAAPKTVSFTAGTESPLAGAYSPFVLRLARPDGSQHISGVETTLPEGLLGRAAGVPYCPESGIAQAIAREAPEMGKLEQGSPSCPSASEVGTVNVTAGSGIAPIPVSGRVYWAGPYKGAPLSVVVIVPAVAGPFDLGTVVDRVALYVGEYDARIHAVADPLPTIRDGIPLDVRSIELKLDRPNFTLNPTSCEAMAIEGSVSTQAGQSAALKNSFQVGECGRLAFKPKLALSLKGQTKRTGHPALKAVVTYPKGGAYANIAKASVSLPHSEFLDQGNIGKACTKPVLAARGCPASSIYGTAKAWSPLLEKPVEGPVYLVGGYGYKLPALVAELDGQIRILLVGKVDTGKTKGIRNTFEAVPDAPVEKFVLEMKGGKKFGLLENSEDICKKKQTAETAFTAQNGKVLEVETDIANSCKKTSHKKNHKAKKSKKAKKQHSRHAKH